MIAQLKVTEPTLTVITPNPTINDLTLDDLVDLQHSIADLLRTKAQGDDITARLATVQKAIKALAVEFGIIPELYAQQDRLLAQQGLKTAIVPITA